MNVSKLPSGGSLWAFRHESANKHVQRAYTSSVISNNTHHIHREPEPIAVEAEPIVVAAAVVEAKPVVDAVATEPVVEAEPIAAAEAVLPISATVKVVHKGRDNRKSNTVDAIDVFDFIIMHIDDHVSLYSDNMKRDAKETCKERLVSFMTHMPASKWFGPKKSRIILAWLTNNKRGTPASDESGRIVASFVSWLLDISVQLKVKDEPIKSTDGDGQYIMCRYKGNWVVEGRHGYREQATGNMATGNNDK